MFLSSIAEHHKEVKYLVLAPSAETADAIVVYAGDDKREAVGAAYRQHGIYLEVAGLIDLTEDEDEQ